MIVSLVLFVEWHGIEFCVLFWRKSHGVVDSLCECVCVSRVVVIETDHQNLDADFVLFI